MNVIPYEELLEIAEDVREFHDASYAVTTVVFIALISIYRNIDELTQDQYQELMRRVN